jgi:hypothetical protein
MGIGLEKRLRKLEKIQMAKTDQVIDAGEAARRRAFLDELRRTPEGRALSLEVAQQLVLAMQAQERAQIEKMTSPEQLERFRKQWADEDAKDEARKSETRRTKHGGEADDVKGKHQQRELQAV